MTRHRSLTLTRYVLAEFIGTFLLVFFGCGAVHVAVLTGALQGLWQVAVVWGAAIMLACYTIGQVSGAHINPAVTLAFATWRQFDKRLVVPYIAGQMAGSMLAAALLFVLFEPHLAAKEIAKGVTRGEPGSIVTAMCYGEYFPNPGAMASGDQPYSSQQHEARRSLVTERLAFGAELFGTLILGFVVFAVTDERNLGRPAAGFAPVFIGLTVAVLIAVLAPLTQACFNPARDFGPRLFASWAGWGIVAWPGWADLSWLTVYIIAPTLGAVAGGGCYEFLARVAAAPAPKEELA